MVTLADAPVVKDSNVYFTLHVKDGIQRYELAWDALTDLAKDPGGKDADLLGLFQIYKDRIIDVAERKVVQPGPATICLNSRCFD